MDPNNRLSGSSEVSQESADLKGQEGFIKFCSNELIN